MAITLVGSHVGAVGTAHVDLAYPPGIINGDRIIIATTTDGSSVTYLNSQGWRLLIANAIGAISLYVFIKPALGNESGTTLTITPTFPVGSVIGASMHVYRGRFSINVLEDLYGVSDTEQNNNGGSASAITAPALGDVIAGSRLLSFGSANTGAAATCTVTGTNWTKQIDINAVNGGVEVVHCMAENITDHGSAANQPTFTWSHAATGLATGSLALRETDASTPIIPTQWNPYLEDQPTKFTAEQMNQVRKNIFAVDINDLATPPIGWGYTNSFTRSEGSPGTAAHPARKYWFSGSGNTKRWVKANITYDGSNNVTKISLYYSDDNESSYVAMTDEDGVYVATLSYDGSNNLQSIVWGITP